MSSNNISVRSCQAGYPPTEPVRSVATASIDTQKMLMPQRNEHYVLKAHKVANWVMYDMYYRNTLVFSSRCPFGRRLVITDNIGFNDQDVIDLCSRAQKFSNGDIRHLSLSHYTEAFKGSSIHGFRCDQFVEKKLTDFLNQFPNLTSIDVADGSHINAVIENCPELTSINLSGYTELTLDDLKNIVKHFPDLTSINLSGCSKLEYIECLAQYCPDLTSIDLSGCHIYDIEKLVQALPHLKSINLGNCKDITTDLVETIAKSCPKLVSINLAGCNEIEDPAIKAIADNCPDLESLNLDGCYHISDDALSRLTRRCSKLMSLSVKNCHFTDQLLSNMLCNNLTFLDLSHNTEITDEGIENLSYCGKLSSISLSSCDGVLGRGIDCIAKICRERLNAIDLSWFNVDNENPFLSLAEFCPNLISLKLGTWAYRISDTAPVIEAFRKGCPNLSELTLIRDQLSNEGFEALAKSFPNLTSIELQYSDITDAGLEALAQHCPKLVSIKLTNCREITNDGYANFKRAHPNIFFKRDGS